MILKNMQTGRHEWINPSHIVIVEERDSEEKGLCRIVFDIPISKNVFCNFYEGTVETISAEIKKDIADMMDEL